MPILKLQPKCKDILKDLLRNAAHRTLEILEMEKNTSSVQRKGADYAARALKSMIQGLGQIFQLFLKIWVMKVIAESMVKKLFVDFLGGKIGF